MLLSRLQELTSVEDRSASTSRTTRGSHSVAAVEAEVASEEAVAVVVASEAATEAAAVAEVASEVVAEVASEVAIEAVVEAEEAVVHCIRSPVASLISLARK